MISLKKIVKDRLEWMRDISLRMEKIQEAIGRIENRQQANVLHADLQSAEFRTFSQWGEDGIIQHLIRSVTIKNKIFIEFGVQKYTESSTRFLLTNNNWSGLVIDGGEENIKYIKSDPIYWQYNLKAECAFITKDNINDIFLKNGISGEIGLLSVDIDGNDYWVWKNINVISPALVIAEYNARFGKDLAVTVPYADNFVRSNAHYSHIYYGASLKALFNLGAEKGYALVGCNSAGNNAFFVRRDLLPPTFRELSCAEAYVQNQFRESRDSSGTLAFWDAEQERELLRTLPLIDVGAAVEGKP